MYPAYKPGNVPPKEDAIKGVKGDVHYSYDVGADVLYISHYEPSPAVCDEILPGVLVRRGMLNKVVGVTLISLEVMELHSAIAALQQIEDMPHELVAFIDTHVGKLQTQMFGESYATR
jgi:hypothetical protein